MKKCRVSKEDPYLALLSLRNTTQEGMNCSPSQRIFGRRTRTLLPTKTSLLTPKIPKNEEILEQLSKRKDKMTYYDKGKDLPPLQINDNVRIQPLQNNDDFWKPGKIIQQVNPRSYIVRTTDNKELRRDRQFLRKQKEPTIQTSEETTAENTTIIEPQPNLANTTQPSTTTRSGRVIRKPARLQYTNK